MARGIDIADIDWVFQFDAPSCASDFVHRCGRTARIGNRGTALAFLQPNEEPYVHFIDINQKVKQNIVPRKPIHVSWFIAPSLKISMIVKLWIPIHQLHFLSNSTAIYPYKGTGF